MAVNATPESKRDRNRAAVNGPRWARLPLLIPAENSVSRGYTRGYTPVDLLSLAYFAINITLLIFGFEHVTNAGLMVAGFSGAFAIVALFRFVPRGGSWVLQFIRDAYPLVLLPAAYWAVGVVNRALFQTYFDDLVLEWDLWLFGGHPNAYLADLFPYAALSEFLHLCYWAYLSVVPILGLALFFRRRFERFRVFATTVTLTFYSCFTMFLFFPVQGPYYTFPRVDAPGSVFPQIVYGVLERGAAVGAAFPSSHVAVSIVVALMAYRLYRRLWPLLLTVSLGITVGTVYGGFHYAVDSAVGLLVGVAAAWAGPRLHARLLRVMGRAQGVDRQIDVG